MTLPQLEREHFPEGLLTIAVFGPGTGEAQLIRFPDGSFGVVDGCRVRNDSLDPVAELLQKWDAPLVRFVCLTHPHVDHFGGLLDLIEIHQPRLLLWAGTENDKFRDHFVQCVRAAQTGHPGPADAQELKKLIQKLADKTQWKPRGTPNARSVVLSDHKRVLELEDNLVVWGVLPTTTSLHRALGAGESRSTATDIEPRTKKGDPNAVSGALLIEWGEARVLLGGDALSGNQERHQGWAAAEWIKGHVQVVKVAHHASSGSHYAPLWDRICPKIALVTPYGNAKGQQPPREQQLKLLLESSRVFLTARPAWWPGAGTLSGFPEIAAPTVAGTPLALADAAVSAPAAGSRNPQAAVSVSLHRDGTMSAIHCAGGAVELQAVATAP